MKFGENLSSFFHLKITRFQNISCFPENSWALLTLFYWFYLFFNTIFSQLIYLCYWGIEPTALSFTTAFVPSHYGWRPTCSRTSGISRHCWWCDWRCVKSITVLNISNNSENYMFTPNKHGDLKHPISGGSLKREENTGHIYRGRQGTKKWVSPGCEVSFWLDISDLNFHLQFYVCNLLVLSFETGPCCLKAHSGLQNS